jgi:exonuclease III
MREKEKKLLKGVVTEMLKKDPDVIIAGDFNTKEKGIRALAQSIGMHVMIPEDQTGVGTTHAGNRYDHFLISPDMVNEEAVRCKIVTYSGSDLKRAKKTSDHLPVLALFNADDQYRDRT